MEDDDQEAVTCSAMMWRTICDENNDALSTGDDDFAPEADSDPDQVFMLTGASFVIWGKQLTSVENGKKKIEANTVREPREPEGDREENVKRTFLNLVRTMRSLAHYKGAKAPRMEARSVCGFLRAARNWS
ncbi:hypothetical protein V5799_016021 [Amblyomma americanum]|uniref:Uncharacterized protein n=1 Tax=Amblyomma americanum TaxID=6943 RepID=A0AAQ4F703_AMBAM